MTPGIKAPPKNSMNQSKMITTIKLSINGIGIPQRADINPLKQHISKAFIYIENT